MRPKVGPREQLALEVWHAMGQRGDWAAYQLLVDLNDLQDPERLFINLLTLQSLTPP